MNELLVNPSFRIFVVCSVLLAFNAYILAGMTGAARGRYKSPVSPEDEKLSGSPFREHIAPEVDRIVRAHRNSVENNPLMILGGLIYVLAGASTMMVAILMGSITLFRILHSVFYLKGMQPGRTSAFALATLAAGIMLIHSLILVLGG